MARGESRTKSPKSAGIAIWAVLIVACLAATWLVVWATDAIDGIESAWLPPYVGEPFAGVEMAFAPLGRADCEPAGGPALPGMAVAARDAPTALTERLTDRGYAPATEWGPPLPLPVTVPAAGLEGGCGVIAVTSQGASHIASGRVRDERQTSCDGSRGLFAVCAGDEVVIEGSGSVVTRSFVMPGLPPSARDDALPLRVRLAHAAAEAQLRSIGWLPDDEIVAVELPSTPAGRTHHSETPPALPTTGCVPWVVVGTGARYASTSWQGRPVAQRHHAGLFVIGAVSCAGGAGSPPAITTLSVEDTEGDGALLFFRAYQAQPGPTVPGAAAPAPAAADMHLVELTALGLPPGVPMQSDAASP